MEIRQIRGDEGLRLRAIRLRALADSPMAYGSTLAREESCPDALWHERALRGATGDNAVTIVAEQNGLLVGMATGLVDAESEYGMQPTLVGVFVDGAVRRQGVGLELARRSSAGQGRAVLRASVSGSRPATRRPSHSIVDAVLSLPVRSGPTRPGLVWSKSKWRWTSPEQCLGLGRPAQERQRQSRAEEAMGSNPYFYFTPYRNDLQAALEDLRQVEFKAGRYDPAMQAADPPSYMFQFDFPPSDASPAPGAQHSSIEEAMDAGEESGTRSILDIMRIADEPDYAAACPLAPGELMELFATTQPTRDLIERVLVGGSQTGNAFAWQFWERIDRGQGRYIVVYENSEPREIFFAGMSWD